MAFMRRAPSLVIGRVADSSTLGIYSISTQICAMASTELIAPIKRALFPGYSKLVSDFDSLRKVYLENFSMIVMLAMPVAAGIGLTAEFLVPVFLGPKWLGAIPVIQILAVSEALKTINTNSNPLYYSTNRPIFYFVLTMLNAVVLLPALWFGVRQGGAVGAAAAVAVAAVVVTVADSVAVVHVLKVPWSRFAVVTWRTLTSVGAMSLGVVLLKTGISRYTLVSSDFGRLVVCSFAGAGAYVAAHVLLWRLSGSPESAERMLIRFARKSVDRLGVGGRVLSRAE